MSKGYLFFISDAVHAHWCASAKIGAWPALLQTQMLLRTFFHYTCPITCRTYPKSIWQPYLGIHAGLPTRTGAAWTSHHLEQVGIGAAASHLLKTSNEITTRESQLHQIVMYRMDNFLNNLTELTIPFSFLRRVVVESTFLFSSLHSLFSSSIICKHYYVLDTVYVRVFQKNTFLRKLKVQPTMH